MSHDEWTALGLAEQWRAVINTALFKQACSVVLEELYRFRTVGSAEVNALQNQFKEGNYSALSTLRALAEHHKPKPEMPKPWEYAVKGEVERELPPGPQKKGLVRE
jgi:cytosine/adenosine deaminase-related metal-dependent hydrolase